MVDMQTGAYIFTIKNITLCQHVGYSQVGNLKKALKGRKSLLFGVLSNKPIAVQIK